jgi:hypothetical protein
MKVAHRNQICILYPVDIFVGRSVLEKINKIEFDIPINVLADSGGRAV